MTTIIISACAFVGGAIVGAGGLAALKAKATAELKTLLADVRADIAKLSSAAGKGILAKIEAIIAKL